MADYDKGIPIASETLRKSQPKIKDNFTAIEDAFGAGHEFETGGEQTGHHLSPIFKDVNEPSAPTESNSIKLYNKDRVLYTIDDNGDSRGVSDNTDIPSGTKMLFKQDSAPSGWTFKSEDNDKVLLNTDVEGDGGKTGGTWQLPTSDKHILTEGELPKVEGEATFRNLDSSSYDLITNPAGVFSVTEGSGATAMDVGESGVRQDLEFSIGNDEGHTHDMPDDWRPSYVKCITCEKD